MGVSPTCPVDRSPIGDGDIQIAPVLIGNLVGDLIVLCPNASEGCTESVQRNMVEAHWRGCGFGMVECGGCGERIRRKDWEQGGCGHKMVECGYCAEEVRGVDLAVGFHLYLSMADGGERQHLLDGCCQLGDIFGGG